MHTKKDIDKLAADFEQCQKILLALGDENRQHMILEMMKMGDCNEVNTCYQINEAESLEVLQEWASNWNDVTDFTFIPVISSHEMSKKMKK